MKKQVRRPRKKIITPKECFYCKEEKTPVYSDSVTLQKFMNDRGKIVGRIRSGLCALHQRRLTSSVKHARHLALLPFVGRG